MKRRSLVLAGVLIFSPLGAHTVFASDGVQEVQTDTANVQKQAIQNQAASPAPTASPSTGTGAQSKNGTKQGAGNTDYQHVRDWRPKTVQTCVKGGISLQLKKAMACPRGFVKK